MLVATTHQYVVVGVVVREMDMSRYAVAMTTMYGGVLIRSFRTKHAIISIIFRNIPGIDLKHVVCYIGKSSSVLF